MRVPFEVPVELGREQAADLARLELAKPRYRAEDEPLVQRAIRWLAERVQELIDTAATTSPLGWFGLLGVLALVVGIVVVVRRRTGPLTRGGAAPALFDGATRDAAAYRAEAEAHAARGDWAEAVRARLRALVRDLADRGLVDAGAGRTADEIAREAGAALPEAAADLRAAARTFDDIWYGGHPAGRASYERVVATDERVAVARPVPGAADRFGDVAVPR
jgi:hypothetical protein